MQECATDGLKAVMLDQARCHRHREEEQFGAHHHSCSQLEDQCNPHYQGYQALLVAVVVVAVVMTG
jgi:hypothetical protein